MLSQQEKAHQFKALHEAGECFIMPNPWDIGSARILANLGYEALATTSAGFANTQGFTDYNVTRDMVMAHSRQLANAVDLPLSADLENGFGDDPETCAETVRLAAEAGLVGGSIEDFTGIPGTQYDVGLAKARIEAAVDAANALDFPFMLTARAENFFTGVPDLADTITRLQAYQEAGAHVLYAPGLKTLADIKTVITSVDRPVNVLMGPKSGFVPFEELAALGAARISLGAALSNTAYGALVSAAREMLATGTLGFLSGAATGKELGEMLTAGKPD